METPTFDEDFLHRLAADDPDSMKQFFAYFMPLLRIKLRSKVRSPRLIDDLAQETLLRVLTGVRDRRKVQPESLDAFVSATCTYVLSKHLRGKWQAQPPARR